MPRAAFVVFDRFQALDAFGPLEVLVGAGDEVELVARHAGPVRASDGAVVLAETGLLDGKPCTTHRRYGERLAHALPVSRRALRHGRAPPRPRSAEAR